MAVVSMKNLLDSGVHFGHQTRRWNPKMKRFIFTERNGIYIIDIQQTLGYIDQAYEFVKQTVAHGGSIMFIGTKRQAQEVIAEQATRVGMPYVNQRWLGGMLTNFATTHRRIQRLRELDSLLDGRPDMATLTKTELVAVRREHEKMTKSLGGVRDMQTLPNAVWVVDTKREHVAVAEARKLGIPVVAILDTNCDPDEVDYMIPGNDDAIRSTALLTRIIADAVVDGLADRLDMPDRKDADTDVSHDPEPLGNWERALIAGRLSQAVELLGDHDISEESSKLPPGLTEDRIEQSFSRLISRIESAEAAIEKSLLTSLLGGLIELPGEASITSSSPPPELIHQSYSRMVSALAEEANGDAKPASESAPELEVEMLPEEQSWTAE